MRRPAIFFDRDNTLIASDGYLGDPAKVTLVTGAADAIARARQLGYATVVFSNQSGVARGMFDENAVHAVNSKMDEMLSEANPAAVIDRHEFCPFHPEGSVAAYRRESPLRKPAPGMILQAAEKLALDLTRSWVIGDAPRDIEAGKAAGCKTILFQDTALPPSPAAAATSLILPDHIVKSLKDAMDVIQREQIQQPARESPTSSETNSANPTVDLTRLEQLGEQILRTLRAPADKPVQKFSMTRLLAGIMQVITLAVALLAWRADNQNTLLVAILMQLFTIALLIMGQSSIKF
jgi:D,D-heptose 1,7-bisphosphate phosphatase